MSDYFGQEADPNLDSQAVLKSALNDEFGQFSDAIQYLLDSPTSTERDLQLIRGLVSLTQFTVQQAIATATQNEPDPDLMMALEDLQEEVNYLRAINSAYKGQVEWFKDQAALSKAAIGRVRRKATMKQCLESTLQITGAETGSIMLVDSSLVVEDYVLFQSTSNEEERQDLVGKVLKKGLAGWVAQNLTAALVRNTRMDDRWIDIPDQPYDVGSALCVPMLREQNLIGILTLTHSEYDYFTDEEANLVWTIAYQVALALETNKLTQQVQSLQNAVQRYERSWHGLVNGRIIGGFTLQNFRFVKVNNRLVGLMGYSAEDLMKMQSISSLIAYEDRDQVNEVFLDCLNGRKPVFSIPFSITRQNGQLVKVMAQGVYGLHENAPAILGVMDSIA